MAEVMDYQKSDLIDSEISTQGMHCLESTPNKSVCHFYWRFNVSRSTLNKSNVESMPKNVQFCEDNDTFVIENSSLDPNRIQERHNVDSMPENVDFCEDNDAFVIENDPLDPKRIQESMPEGRRIVDISFIWNEIHRKFDNHAREIECQFKDW